MITLKQHNCKNMKVMYLFNCVHTCTNPNWHQYIVQRIFKQIVQGLLYLHAHQIVHRDLSLANLLLTKDMDAVSYVNYQEFSEISILFVCVCVVENCWFWTGHKTACTEWEALYHVWNPQLYCPVSILFCVLYRLYYDAYTYAIHYTTNV